ncbi:unnamed protein product [Merluccius merluccius]
MRIEAPQTGPLGGLTIVHEDGRLCCVFELMDHSVWNDVKQQPQGLESDLLRKYVFQMLRGMEYLHSVNACLNMNPKHRATCSELLCREFFTCDSFHQR